MNLVSVSTYSSQSVCDLNFALLVKAGHLKLASFNFCRRVTSCHFTLPRRTFSLLVVTSWSVSLFGTVDGTFPHFATVDGACPCQKGM